MVANARHLEKLIDLAHEPSSDKRRELLEEVTDLFLEQPAAHSDRETELFGDVMAKVAYQVEMAVRQRLAERLSTVPEAPHELIVTLANDEIDVARPILQHSGVLRDEDLIAVAQSKGQEHLLAVSRRESVSEQVADALVERGDDEVLVSLVSNTGAELSRGAMETIVARSETSERLQRPLVERADLPPDLMHQMFWWVSSAMREYIATKTNIDSAILEEVLEESRSSLDQQIRSHEDDLRRAARKVRRMQRLGQLNESAMVVLLRQREMAEFLVAFATLTELDLATARRVLYDRSHEGLAIACKATGFDRSTFSAILLLADEAGEKRTRKASDVAGLMRLYDRIPMQTAKRTMRFWRVRRQVQDEGAEAGPQTATA